MQGYRIERERADLSRWRTVPESLEANEGEVVARIDLAALTSNNVSYAVHGGPPFHYWNFFPATDTTFCVVPLWGYGTIIQSRVGHVAEGSRFYGYWPSASHLRLQPGPLKASGLADMAAHRQGLAPVYNSYRPADHMNDPAARALHALFQPLYATGFVLARSLAADAAAGHQVLITSASSKTAMATAFNLERAGTKPIGFTSDRNRAFVERSGLYAQVLTYDEVEQIDPAKPGVLVDFAGNGALKARIHARARGLTTSLIVGDTDWASSPHAELAGPQPSMFFAPSAWEALSREIGPAAFEAELAQSLSDFLAATPGWLMVETVTGADGYESAFGRLLSNKAPANLGLVWQP
jgi:hypothetical protein